MRSAMCLIFLCMLVSPILHSSNSSPELTILQDEVKPNNSNENELSDIGDPSIRQIGDWMHGEIVAITSKPHITYMLESKHLAILNITYPTNPKLITEVKLPSMGSCIFEDDSILYIGYGPWDTHESGPEGGFFIYDVTNPSEPEYLGAYTAHAKVLKIEIREQTAFILTETSKMEILDITIPTDITLLGSYTYIHEDGYRSYQLRDFELSGNYALIADIFRGLVVVDISNVANPIEIVSCDTVDGFGYGIEVEWPYAYLADGHGGLSSFDITDYTTPFILDTLIVENEYSHLSLMSAFFLNDIIFSAIMGLGLSVIDVSNPLDLQEIEQYNLGGEVGFMEPSGYGNILTCPEHRQGLHIIDIRNPSEQREVAVYSNPSFIGSIEVYGNQTLIGNKFDGLRVLDISNISDIQCESFSDGISTMDDMEMLGSRVYSSEGNRGLAVVDIHNITTPLRMDYNCSSDQMMATSVLIDGRFVYLASSIGGLFVYEISLEDNVTFITSLPIELSYPADMVQVSNTIFIVDYYGGFFIIDVSDPRVPVLLSDTPIPGNARAIEVIGNYAYIGTIYDNLVIVDISNPGEPTIESYYVDNQHIVDLEQDGGLLFMGDVDYGLSILDLANPLVPTRIAYFNSLEMRNAEQHLEVTQGMIFIGMNYVGLIVLEYDHDGDGVFSREEFQANHEVNSITHLEDITLYESASEYTIQWDYSVVQDSWVEVRNGSDLLLMEVNNVSDRVSTFAKNLTLGENTFSLKVWDQYGLCIQDTIILTVTNDSIPLPMEPAVLFGIVVGASSCVLLVYIIWVVNRRPK